MRSSRVQRLACNRKGVFNRPAGMPIVGRWKKGNKLINACSQEGKAWEMARGKGSWGEAKLP